MNIGQKQGPGFGSCLLFLIIVGVAGFVLLGGGISNGPNPNGNVGPAGGTGPGNEPIQDLGFEQPPTGRVEQHSDASDWALDSVPSKQSDKNSQNSESTSVRSKRSESGDWGMDEVPIDSKKSDSSVKPDSKSTQQGDWEMEEVEGKKGG